MRGWGGAARREEKRSELLGGETGLGQGGGRPRREPGTGGRAAIGPFYEGSAASGRLPA